MPRPRRPTSTPSSPCASAKACRTPDCCGRGRREAAGLLHAAIPAGRRRVVLLVAHPAFGTETRAVHLLHEDAGLEGRRGRAALADALGIVAVEVLGRRAGLGPVVPDTAPETSEERDGHDQRSDPAPSSQAIHAGLSSPVFFDAT